MTKIEILNYLELIESELTDAYNVTPDTSENSDTLYYIDNTKDLVNELMDNINGKFDNRPMGPDGLPLVHIEPGIYLSGNGEGNN